MMLLFDKFLSLVITISQLQKKLTYRKLVASNVPLPFGQAAVSSAVPDVFHMKYPSGIAPVNYGNKVLFLSRYILNSSALTNKKFINSFSFESILQNFQEK